MSLILYRIISDLLDYLIARNTTFDAHETQQDEITFTREDGSDKFVELKLT